MTDTTRSEPAPSVPAPTVPVWDIGVRVFHWGLVAAFTIAFLSGDEIESLHEGAGYVALALIGLRLVWGLVGGRYARFSQFVRRPRDVLDYLKAMGGGTEPRYLGHNPAGGAMIIALLLAMLGTGLTGWMFTLDAFWGVEWVEDLHEVMANLMLSLVIVHVLGVIVASIRHRENLARAMVTGRKRPPGDGDIA